MSSSPVVREAPWERRLPTGRPAARTPCQAPCHPPLLPTSLSSPAPYSSFMHQPLCLLTIMASTPLSQQSQALSDLDMQRLALLPSTSHPCSSSFFLSLCKDRPSLSSSPSEHQCPAQYPQQRFAEWRNECWYRFPSIHHKTFFYSIILIYTAWFIQLFARHLGSCFFWLYISWQWAFLHTILNTQSYWGRRS